jgi:four helix bundle protein
MRCAWEEHRFQSNQSALCKYAERELSRFLHIALGSASEIEFQLGPAVKLELLDAATIEPAPGSCLSVQRMLTRLIVRLRPATGASRGRPCTDEPKH